MACIIKKFINVLLYIFAVVWGALEGILGAIFAGGLQGKCNICHVRNAVQRCTRRKMLEINNWINKVSMIATFSKRLRYRQKIKREHFDINFFKGKHFLLNFSSNQFWCTYNYSRPNVLKSFFKVNKSNQDNDFLLAYYNVTAFWTNIIVLNYIQMIKLKTGIYEYLKRMVRHVCRL